MMKMKKKHDSLLLLPVLVLLLMLSSCYHNRTLPRRLPGNLRFTEQTLDSLSFFSTHHYTNNYNFVVKGDSLMLVRQQPEEQLAGMRTDTFYVYKGDHVVVADIRIVPTDSIDRCGWNWPTTRRPSVGRMSATCCPR